MSADPFFCHPSSYIDQPSSIGEGSKIWHFCHIMENSTIGKDCNIGQNVVISPDVVIGDRVKIQNNVSVYSGVIIEDEVFLGPSCVFTNVINPRSAIARKSEYKTTLIKRGTSVGANATIICGVTLGEYCFIGAGSVVTKDVEPYSLVLGNPAVPKGWYSAQGYKLVFDEKGVATCPSGDQYEFREGKVVLK
jgi:UDP-2-acetamido-3-amino-2,3-dideoxy-glucuronate N-acetyltransferase